MKHKNYSIFKRTTAFFLMFVMLASSGLSTFAEEIQGSTKDDSITTDTNTESTTQDSLSDSIVEDDGEDTVSGDSYSVYVMNLENGIIYVNGEAEEETVVQSGETVSITYEANEGYELSSISFLNDDAEEVECVFKDDTYTFTMPEMNVVVMSEFTQKAAESGETESSGISETDTNGDSKSGSETDSAEWDSESGMSTSIFEDTDMTATVFYEDEPSLTSTAGSSITVTRQYNGNYPAGGEGYGHWQITDSSSTYLGACLNASKPGYNGTYTVKKVTNNSLKACLLALPGNDLYNWGVKKNTLKSHWPTSMVNSTETAYMYLHLAASVLYSGDWYNTTGSGSSVTWTDKNTIITQIVNWCHEVAKNNEFYGLSLDNYTLYVVDTGSSTQSFGWVEGGQPGINIQKTSMNTTLTDGNSDYAFSANCATYGVYSDAACTTLVGTHTLHADGKTGAAIYVNVGTYYVKEIKAPSGYLLNPKVYTVDATTPKASIWVQVQDAPIVKATITIHKQDQDGNAVQGAEFTVYGYNPTTQSYSTEIETKITDSKGLIVFSSLSDSDGYLKTGNGLFLVKETKIPDGYVFSEETYLNDDDKADFEKYGGRLYYVKAKGGACVAYRDTEAIWILNDSTVDSVTAGTGRVVLDCDSGNLISDTYNAPVNATTNTAWLASGTSTWTYKDNAQMSNGSSVWYRSNIPVTSDYYTIDTSTKTCTMKAFYAHTYSYTGSTRNIPYKVNVAASSTKHEYHSDLMAYKFSNITFALGRRVFDSSGNICADYGLWLYNNGSSTSPTVTAYTVTDDGDESDKQITSGTMASKGSIAIWFSETKLDNSANAKLYIQYNGQNVSDAYGVPLKTREYIGSVFVNNAKAKITIKKSSSNSDLTDDNSLYSFEGAQYGIYTDEECVNCVGVHTIQADGTTPGYLKRDEGTYYIKEIKAPKGYRLDTTVYPVTLSWGQVYTLKVTDDPITQASITIHKKDEDGNAISGAEFTVYGYDLSTESYSREVETKTTDSDGLIVFSSLSDSDGYLKTDNGLFLVKETKVPVGYSFSENTYLNDDDKADFEKYGGRLYYVKAHGGACVAYRDTNAVIILNDDTSNITTERVVLDLESGNLVSDIYYNVAANQSLKTRWVSENGSDTYTKNIQMSSGDSAWYRACVKVTDGPYCTPESSTKYVLQEFNTYTYSFKNDGAITLLDGFQFDATDTTYSLSYNTQVVRFNYDTSSEYLKFAMKRCPLSTNNSALYLQSFSTTEHNVEAIVYTNDGDQSDKISASGTMAKSGTTNGARYDFQLEKTLDNSANSVLELYVDGILSTTVPLETVEYLDSVFVNSRQSSLTLQKVQDDSYETPYYANESYNLYSLEDATYAIYANITDAITAADTGETNGTQLYVLTSKDEDGTFDAVTLAAGTYFVVELAAPKNYERDTTVHEVTLSQGEDEILLLQDKAKVDVQGFAIQKLDSSTQSTTVSRADGSLEDAEFTVKYYDGYYTSLDAVGNNTAVRTWVCSTDKNGHFATYMTDNSDVKSYVDKGSMYYDLKTAIPCIPYGTLVINETKAPAGYAISNETWIVNIGEDYDGNFFRKFYNGDGKPIEDTSKVVVGDKDNASTIYVAEDPLKITIDTVATDSNTSVHIGNWQNTDDNGCVTIKDEVTIENLVVGKSYVLKAYLKDKDTKNYIPMKSAYVNNSDSVCSLSATKKTATYTFSASSTTMTLPVYYQVSADSVKGKTIVATDWLGTSSSSKLTSHASLTDADQTVYYPEVTTEAFDITTNSHQGDTKANIKTGDVLIRDEVTCKKLLENLTNYKTDYTMFAFAYADEEKANADVQILKDNNYNLTSIYNTTNKVGFGSSRKKDLEDLQVSEDVFSIEVEALYDMQQIKGKKLVIYEYLADSDTGIVVAQHADFNDAKQTVSYITYSVEIEVTDGDGDPKPNTEVTIKNEDGEVIDKGTTDEKGKITFDDVPPGKYEITETETGETKEVDVEKDTVVELRAKPANLPQTGIDNPWNPNVFAFWILICGITPIVIMYFVTKRKKAN